MPAPAAPKTKVLTVRLCEEDARRAEIIARTDGISVNEVFRHALEALFEKKRADEDFMTRARALVARDEAMLQ